MGSLARPFGGRRGRCFGAAHARFARCARAGRSVGFSTAPCEYYLLTYYLLPCAKRLVTLRCKPK